MEIKVKENLYDLMLNLHAFSSLLSVEDEKIVYEYSKYLVREINKMHYLEGGNVSEFLLDLNDELIFFKINNLENLKSSLFNSIKFLSKELDI